VKGTCGLANALPANWGIKVDPVPVINGTAG